MSKCKFLFILKRRVETVEEQSVLYTYCLSTGLLNSVRFICDMLNETGVEANYVEVADNNDIDREVNKYKPTHVVIEAFWVVPEKFDLLKKLHHKVKWIIRNHSELPFLANDSSATGWALQYIQKEKVYVATNSVKSYEDILNMASAVIGRKAAHEKILFMPNYYVFDDEECPPRKPIGHTINIGCFGAIRPFKNHITQVSAAIKFAQRNNLKLRFHINTGRIEEKGNPVLKSIRSIFQYLDPTRYSLVEHHWLEHDEFIHLVNKMDIGLQVSFTETFNIVAADFVSKNVPIVVSKEIFWMPSRNHADPTDSEDIAKTMENLLFGVFPKLKNALAKSSLEAYNRKSMKTWLNYISSEMDHKEHR
ncbi:hypothetical protein UFOVP49_39 [uncultured Caudovirales phage]|uniref:Glycosyl transferases group 1 n=1 Tax=uncultured Caudovirales phage TaxID=2100421 RepID=A0A6J5KP76_9CAUD|nr:hypothetical protein UFOVP49_39 [uncultured Caudovirales phage]